jgi:N-acetylated-alpha-linked acidic dipeptidase
MVMRIAGAELLPHEFGNFSETTKGYVGELKTLRDNVAKRIDETNRQIAEGSFAMVNDPRRPMLPPKAEAPAPFMNFAPLENAADAIDRVARRFEKAYGAASAVGAPAASLAQVNGVLRRSDQALLLPDGLPKRPWYRHSLYAPGYYTGYGVKTVPGVREAIEQRDWKLADVEIGRVAAALMREHDLIQQASELLERIGAVRPVP